MIRKLLDNEIEISKTLYNESYPCENNYSDSFFGDFFDKDCCYVYLENEKIISILYRYIQAIRGLGKVSYIFAPSTRKNYRGQGYMTKLLEYIDNLNEEEGLVGSFLIPASDEYFLFYQNRGYKNVSFVHKFDFKKTNDSIFPFNYDYNAKMNEQFVLLAEKDSMKILSVYRKFFENKYYVIRTKKFFSNYIKALYEINCVIYGYYKGSNLVGYAFYNPFENEIVELVSLENRDVFLNSILNYEGKDFIKVVTYDNMNSDKMCCLKLYGGLNIEDYYANLLGN